MPSLLPVADRLVGQPFTKLLWDAIEDDINHLVVAGADLASATSLVTTHGFHKVTGAVTIDNISPVAPLAGQQVRLWFTGAPTIRNLGGGTGNIRTQSGADLLVVVNQIVTFVYDGALWREQARLPPATITGRVAGTGAIVAGTGFSVVRNSAGLYAVTFAAAFAAVPTVTGNCADGSAFMATINTSLVGSFVMNMRDGAGAYADVAFNFIATPTA